MTRGIPRVLFLAYPTTVILCVMATGNHYLFDVLGAAPFLAAAYLGHLGLERLAETPRINTANPVAQEPSTTQTAE